MRKLEKGHSPRRREGGNRLVFQMLMVHFLEKVSKPVPFIIQMKIIRHVILLMYTYTLFKQGQSFLLVAKCSVIVFLYIYIFCLL